MPRHPTGEPIRMSVAIRDLAGALVDAGTLTLTIQKPDATLQVYASPTHDSLGLYHQDVPTADLNLVGHYAYKWVSTGIGAGVSFGSFDVFDPFDVAVLDLEDAKEQLNIPLTTTTYDAEIQMWIDTIQATLERHNSGPIVTRSITERVESTAGDTALMLSKRPLVAVTAIADVSGGALSITDVDVDPNSRIVRRKLGLPFSGSSGVYNITYTAGWGTSVPPAFNGAARIILDHLWATQRGPSTRPLLSGEETVQPPGWPFAIPNRALELVAPYTVEAFV